MRDQRIASLDERHHRIDEVIAQEASRPASDDLDLSRMKRERLHLKDRISSLRT